ncbi:MAG: hypothetical protein ABIV50_05675, partial [Opitutus sp.]
MPTNPVRSISATRAASATASSSRLAATIDQINLGNTSIAATQLKTMNASPAEFATAFRRLAPRDSEKARNLVLAFDE